MLGRATSECLEYTGMAGLFAPFPQAFLSVKYDQEIDYESRHYKDLGKKRVVQGPPRLLMLSLWFRCGVANRAEAFIVFASTSRGISITASTVWTARLVLGRSAKGLVVIAMFPFVADGGRAGAKRYSQRESSRANILLNFVCIWGFIVRG